MKSFNITFVALNEKLKEECTSTFNRTINSIDYSAAYVSSISAADLPLWVVHAIIISSDAIKNATNKEVEKIRELANLGTCRVYVIGANLSANPLYDFLHQPNEFTPYSIAIDIHSYFKEADVLNRKHFLYAVRDQIAIKINSAYIPFMIICLLLCIIYSSKLGLLYVFDIEVLRFMNREVFLLICSFLMAFYTIQTIIRLIRTIFFGTILSIVFSFKFYLILLFHLIICTSGIAFVLTHNVDAILLIILAVFGYALFILFEISFKIRTECTSISYIHSNLSESATRQSLLDGIKLKQFNLGAFPILSFRHKSLFISYQHSSIWSTSTANSLYHYANRNGYKVFLDNAKIPSGSIWRQHLLREISRSNIFVCVLDGSYSSTNWALTESTFAALSRKNLGKPYIMIIGKNVDKIADDTNPFNQIFYDIFHSDARHFNASLWSTDNNSSEISDLEFENIFSKIQPLSILTTNPIKYRKRILRNKNSQQLDVKQIINSRKEFYSLNQKVSIICIHFFIWLFSVSIHMLHSIANEQQKLNQNAYKVTDTFEGFGALAFEKYLLICIAATIGALFGCLYLLYFRNYWRELETEESYTRTSVVVKFESVIASLILIFVLFPLFNVYKECCNQSFINQILFALYILIFTSVLHKTVQNKIGLHKCLVCKGQGCYACLGKGYKRW